VGELSFSADGRKLDFLFNRNINQSNAYNALRAEGNASRIGIADTAANFQRSEGDSRSIVNMPERFIRQVLSSHNKDSPSLAPFPKLKFSFLD
jgi:hypothetical protein